MAATLGIPPLRGRAHAGISRRTRAPSLRELYSGALGRFVVNPDLGPETLLAAEIGITAGGAGSQWQIVGFHHRSSDGIVRTSAGDGRFQRVNRDRVLTTGLELIGGIRWKAVLLDGDLTLQGISIDDPAAPSDERQLTSIVNWMNLEVRAMPSPAKNKQSSTRRSCPNFRIELLTC